MVTDTDVLCSGYMQEISWFIFLTVIHHSIMCESVPGSLPVVFILHPNKPLQFGGVRVWNKGKKGQNGYYTLAIHQNKVYNRLYNIRMFSLCDKKRDMQQNALVHYYSPFQFDNPSVYACTSTTSNLI